MLYLWSNKPLCCSRHLCMHVLHPPAALSVCQGNPRHPIWSHTHTFYYAPFSLSGQSSASHLKPHTDLLLWTLLEGPISRWALNASQGQLYSAILCSWADSLCFSHMQPRLQPYTAWSEYPLKWLQRCLVVTWLVPPETAAILAHVLCAAMDQFTVSLHSKPCTRVLVCLAVTATCTLGRMTRIFYVLLW